MSNCTICGTAFQLKYAGTTLKQCENCKVILAYSESGFWKTAAISPVKFTSHIYIKPGTKGVCERRGFEVTGRINAANEVDTTNYWSILFADGERAVMNEGYGHYSIMTKTTAPFPVNFEDIKSMAVGDGVSSKGKKFRLIRRTRFDIITAEGECNWPNDSNINSYEFFCYDGDYIEIFEFDHGFSHHYSNKFYLPQELKFTDTAAAAQPETLTCFNCNAKNTVYALPYSFTFNCTSCGCRHEYNRNSGAYVRENGSQKKGEPLLAIGSNGKFYGTEFKVIGYAQKQERTADQAIWNEYTLYNPVMGFAYLSEYQGHWVYVKEWPRPPLMTSKGKDYFVENDNEFELFNDYGYKVIAALGEHIYDLNKVNDVKVAEYISPPQILTSEKSKGEETWFHGDHIDAKEIEAAFSMQHSLPAKIGVGAVQPIAYTSKAKLAAIATLGILLVVLLHVFFTGRKQPENVFGALVSHNELLYNFTATSPPFELNQTENNVEVNIYAPVDNSWIEAEGTFVNMKTGKEYSFEKGVEFYSGYDSDGSWSEGSKSAKVVLTELPKGKYYLEYNFKRDSISAYSPGVNNSSIEVKSNVPLNRNLYWAIGFIIAAALIQYLIFYYYDKKRWSNSKYTPYNYDYE